MPAAAVMDTEMGVQTTTLLFVAVLTLGFTVAPATATEAGTAAVQTCDYADLYESAIDSVVSVLLPDGQGTGYVYAVDEANQTATVVTNQHVIRNRENARIQFSSGEYRSGRVVGTDVYSDLAVIEVSNVPGYVPALPLADNPASPGEPVAALGTPFGLEGTITQGIVSGVNRSMPTDRGFTIPDTVQTDAPINPGNSGGPLVRCDGEVVGVNRAGGGQNIGFAVSAPLIERVVPSLIETGDYQHPRLGVRATDVTPEIANRSGLDSVRGVIVANVIDNGPADGVLRGSNRSVQVRGQKMPMGGDVIVAINGTEIRSQEQLASYLVLQTSPGDTVELTIIRNGEQQTVTVTLGRRANLDT